ncbi:hypothetical protein QEN19_000994 [Hanseniaspora menglaensis]
MTTLTERIKPVKSKASFKQPSYFYKAYKIFLCFLSVNIFIAASLAIVTQQFLTKLFLFKFVNLQQTLLNDSKKKFIILLITIFKINTPKSKIRISIPKAINQKYGVIKNDGRTVDLSTVVIASTNFTDESVVIANHQIYTDWVYLWWLAYTSNLAGNVYILLKKSLESIPILGYGMKNYQFIFLSRKWEKDQVNLRNSINDINLNSRGIGRASGRVPIGTAGNGEYIWPEHLDLSFNSHKSKTWPYQLILFPEGTNLSANTKNKSIEYAKKIDKAPFQNVLLPHVTGIYEILKNLTSCKTLYDLTIGYSGVEQHEFAQDIYTLKKVFLEGASPEIVDIHLTAIDRTDIPLENIDSFSDWLFGRWKLKDDLMNEYYLQGSDFKTEDTAHEYSTYIFDCGCNFSEYLSILLGPFFTFVLLLRYVIKWIF